jgi:hypothetical protein
MQRNGFIGVTNLSLFKLWSLRNKRLLTLDHRYTLAGKGLLECFYGLKLVKVYYVVTKVYKEIG